ncbi:Uncharacterised protein [Mycobacteroides abscessus subsp. abscessus]|nr:Uncharacterised protein [Mycobacteroides abscessus subsp. abscessus]
MSEPAPVTSYAARPEWNHSRVRRLRSNGNTPLRKVSHCWIRSKRPLPSTSVSSSSRPACAVPVPITVRPTMPTTSISDVRVLCTTRRMPTVLIWFPQFSGE